jgi:putative membrane-bound dehydrogenase-like protein
MLNSFNWGLDHRIHGSSSSNGGDITRPEAPGEKALALRGRDFAIDPRSMVMYPEGGGAQHGMSFDDWGRRFVCSNSDHIQLITYDDHYAARNPHLAAPGARISIAADGAAADVFRISPVEPWRIVRTRLRVKGITPGLIEGGGRAAGYFTSATGVTIYRGDAWPEAYRGNAFIGDVGGNLVHRKTLDADGASLIARRADEGREFIASSDIWFRPVQFANAPDGTLYIADMYRETIEHPDSLPEVIKKHLDLSSGSDRGRVYRIAPKGFARKPLPDLGAMASADLVPLLAHENAWHRETAARLIYERQDTGLAAALAAASRELPNELGRMTALHALIGLGVADEAVKQQAVAAALGDAGPRVRQHAILLAEAWLIDAPALQEKLLALVDDADAQVRYQLAFSLGEFEHPGRGAALARLATHDADTWTRFAVLSSAGQDIVPFFNAYFSAAGESPTPEWVDLLTRQAVASGAEGVGAVRALAKAESERLTWVARRCVSALGPVLRDSSAPEDQALLEKTLVASLDDAQRSDLAASERIAAIAFLAFGESDRAQPVLAALLAQGVAPECQVAALDVLSRQNDAAAAQMALSAWPGFGPRAREAAVEALFRRKPWLEALVGAMEVGSFAPRDLDSNRSQALLKHEDAALRARAEKLFADSALKPRDEVVQAWQDVLTMTGDGAKGREIYLKNCAQCHKIKDDGFAVGPDLTTVAQGGTDKILTNLLDPNREVNQQYINYTVSTKDLETHTGILVSDTASSVTLKRAYGETVTVLRADIEEMRSEKLSLMPEGLEATLQKQDLADLMAFITGN